jgi:hypothetical protein
MPSSPPERRGPPDRKTPAEWQARSEWKALFAGTLNFSVLTIGVVSGIAQLADFPTGFARALLLAVFLTCLLYFVIRVWQFYFVEKVRELRAQLAKEAEKLTLAQSGHRRYLDAIERISDREKPLFAETLEVIVWIGVDDETDRIMEKRVTTPDPLVTHRAMRPIVPTDQEQIVRLDDIAFRVSRSGGRITALPLHEQIRKLRVWLIFDPALSARTEWEVEYRPHSLWRPLRERGWDQLVWDDRLPTAHGSPSAFTRFTVRFKFPDSDQPPSVKERQGYGELTEPARDESGMWEVVWRDKAPAGRHYVWDLTQAPGGTRRP